MAIFKCKMCGGTLEIMDGQSVCECEYCGSKQTVPNSQDEGLQTLYNRANVLRMKSEFDKASEIYEKILQKNETEAEAYWGLILCKYGIEYVEDPATYKRVPTCHRASYDAVTADEDYKNAINNADISQKIIYEEEARAIDEIQRGIIALAQKEDPYDVFICYKETDENGRRTQDSVIANDIYHHLSQEGFKVFYAAITLESKLGTEYEPYIFSALNTAKVMLAIGTKSEYFNAVWVKNEWSRFLKIMKKDRSKLLIPCYRDMDPYELPEEFAHLQAQDMGKIGFVNDIIRGIKKVIIKESPSNNAGGQPSAGAVYSSNVGSLIKRGNMALEDRDWKKADGFFEEVLNQDAECAEAYLGKLLADKECSTVRDYFSKLEDKYKEASTERLQAASEDTQHIAKAVEENVIPKYLSAEKIRCQYDFDFGYDSGLSDRRIKKLRQQREIASDKLLTRAVQYAKGETKKQLDTGIEALNKVLEERIQKDQEEDEANIARIKSEYQAHILAADEKVKQIYEEAAAVREKDYQSYISEMKAASGPYSYGTVKSKLLSLNGYKESAELAEKCQQEIDRVEREREEEKRSAEERRRKKSRNIKIAIVSVAAAAVAAYFLITQVIIPNNNYNAAVALKDSGEYEAAIDAFTAMDGYKDSAEQIAACEAAIIDNKYNDAVAKMESGEYEAALEAFTALGGYKDSAEQIAVCEAGAIDNKYNDAVAMMDSGKYSEAIKAFNDLDGYKDSSEKISACMTAIRDAQYNEALRLKDSGDYVEAYTIFQKLSGYKDSTEQMKSIKEAYSTLNYVMVEVGDIFEFGTYEQDNDTNNGKEPVNWHVLDKKDGSILVISEYGLDCQPYDTEHRYPTWASCTLRTWLNNIFYNSVFSPDEQSMILEPITENPEYSTYSGNTTKDKVFLLSIPEAEKYFASDQERRCTPTAYAEAMGVKTMDDYKTASGAATCWWWLRSPGDNGDMAGTVKYDGSTSDGYVHNATAVRPALWINLES